jgi:hypothetical protein
MITSQKNLIHFPPNSVAGCISNVECSVGGNLELRQTLVSLTLRGWRHIQNLCGFSTPTAMGQSFIMTLHKLPSSSHEKTSVTENFEFIIAESSDSLFILRKNFRSKKKREIKSSLAIDLLECQFIIQADLVGYSKS